MTITNEWFKCPNTLRAWIMWLISTHLVIIRSYKAMLQSFSSFTSKYSTRLSWRKSSNVLQGKVSGKNTKKACIRQSQIYILDSPFKCNFQILIGFKRTCSPETIPQCVCSSQLAVHSLQWCRVCQEHTERNANVSA